MANFRTHITVSTVAGIGYAGAGYAYGVPLSTCLVAGGLCSVSGMLPDLDSGSGVPMRETWAMLAAVVPALMIPRFVQLGFDTEQMALAAGVIYIVIRFGIADLFQRFTVHRGMWHSLPAAAIAGLVAFLIVSGCSLEVRLFKTVGVVLGFMIHLALDEFWSFEMRRGRLRIKRSLGTALKFWSTRSLWANVSAYGKLALLVVIVIGDPYLMDQLGVQQPELAHKPKQWVQSAVDRSEPWLPSWDLASESPGPWPLASQQPNTSIEIPSGENVWQEQSPPAETARRAHDDPTTPWPVHR